VTFGGGKIIEKAGFDDSTLALKKPCLTHQL